MKVIKIDGTRRKYVFDNGQEVDFNNKALYAQLKRQNMNDFLQRPGVPEVVAHEPKVVTPEEPKITQPVILKRPRAKWVGK